MRWHHWAEFGIGQAAFLIGALALGARGWHQPHTLWWQLCAGALFACGVAITLRYLRAANRGYIT